MSETTGRITLVWTEELGTTLTQDEAAGATVLHVDDVSPFNDDGELDEDGNLGYLLIGSQTVGYTAVDDDASTITLAEALAEDAEEADDVLVWNDLYNKVDDQQWAWVQPDGKDRQAPIQARVKESLELEDGDRGKRGESCTVRRRKGSDDWRVTGVRGRPSQARGLKHEPDDPHTLTTDELDAGSFVHALAHTGIAFDRALVCYANGVAYGPDHLDIDSDNGVVTVTLGGWEKTTTDVWFDYWYRNGPKVAAIVPDPPPPPPDPEPVNFTVVGYTSGHGAHSAAAFPAGAQEGDLFVYACTAVAAGQTNSCTDGRATLAVDKTLSSCTARAWVGIVSSPSTPLTAVATEYASGASGASETGWALLVIRPDSPTDWDLTTVPDSGVQGSGSIPGLSGLSGAVGLGFSRGGLGGGGAHTWASPWVTGSMNFLGGTYAVISFATQVNSGTIAATPAIEPDDPWRGFLLGVGKA